MPNAKKLPLAIGWSVRPLWPSAVDIVSVWSGNGVVGKSATRASANRGRQTSWPCESRNSKPRSSPQTTRVPLAVNAGPLRGGSAWASNAPIRSRVVPVPRSTIRTRAVPAPVALVRRKTSFVPFGLSDGRSSLSVVFTDDGIGDSAPVVTFSLTRSRRFAPRSTSSVAKTSALAGAANASAAGARMAGSQRRGCSMALRCGARAILAACACVRQPGCLARLSAIGQGRGGCGSGRQGVRRTTRLSLDPPIPAAPRARSPAPAPIPGFLKGSPFGCAGNRH